MAGFLDRSSKASIKTEDLAKAMVFNATKKNIEGKTEILEHAEILKVSKEALESSTVSLVFTLDRTRMPQDMDGRLALILDKP